MGDIIKELAITREQAIEAAQRLINGAFRRDGEHLADDKRPRFSIPSQPERDDDLVLMAYLREASLVTKEPGEAPNPVAWRVRDFADGWILYSHYRPAWAEAKKTGAVIQGLIPVGSKTPAEIWEEARAEVAQKAEILFDTSIADWRMQRLYEMANPYATDNPVTVPAE